MKYLITMLLLCSMIVSCKKSNDTTKNNITEAPAANDNSSAGIYKGVFVGSSGTVKIVLLNGNTTIKAYITFNGYHDTLTATTSVVAGAAISNLQFIGSQMSFSFSTAANGANPSITNITYAAYPNPIRAIIAKQLSTQLVSCYEGTYYTVTGGSDAGTFNCIIFGDAVVGLAHSNSASSTTFDQVTGSVSGTGVISASGGVSTGANFTGQITGTNCNGNWTNTSAGYTGKWQGTKAL